MVVEEVQEIWFVCYTEPAGNRSLKSCKKRVITKHLKFVGG